MLLHLGMIAENICDGIAIIDPHGAIHFVNTACAKMHGYSTGSELLGKNIDIFHNQKQSKDQLQSCLAQAKSNGGFSGVINHTKRNGMVFPTQTRVVVLRDKRKKIDGFMVLLTDMTECTQLKEKTAAAEQQLHKAKANLAELEHQLTEKTQEQEVLKHKAAELNSKNQELLGQSASSRETAAELERQLLDIQNEVTRLTDTNEQLKKRINEIMTSADQFQKQVEALIATNEQLRRQAGQPSTSPKAGDHEPPQSEDSDYTAISLNPERLKQIAELAKKLRS